MDDVGSDKIDGRVPDGGDKERNSMVHVEGNVYRVRVRGNRWRYRYRRLIPEFVENGTKYRDVKRWLGYTFSEAVHMAAKLDEQLEAQLRGGKPAAVGNLGELCAWYVTHVRFDRRLKGARTMLSNIGTFRESVGASVRLSAITRNTVQAFLDRLRVDRGLRPSTLNGYLRDVRRMLTVAVDEGYVEKNPAIGIRMLKPSRTEPRIPSVDELRKLFEYLKLRKRWLYRICLTLVSSGCRVNEALMLTWDKVDAEGGWLTLPRRKVSDELRMPMTPQLKAEIWALWMEAGRPDRGPVFMSKSGRHFTPTRVGFAFKPVVRRLGLDWLMVKSFRKLAATAVARQSNTRVAQQLLGHTSVRTTEIYLGDGAKDRAVGVEILGNLLLEIVSERKPGEEVGKVGTEVGTLEAPRQKT